MNNKDNIKQVSVRITEDKATMLKIVALKNQTTVQKILEDKIDEILKEDDNKERGKNEK